METMIYTSHFEDKIKKFQEHWVSLIGYNLNKISLHPSKNLATRCKADFVIETHLTTQVMGFYSPQTKNLEDIKESQLFSPELQQAYSEFRKRAPRVVKGSVRIRISPTYQKGLWLDFANTDIRDLLEEKTQLQNLATVFDIIEIGQKKKILNIETFKLEEPKSYPWFETYAGHETIPLFCNVASFTQTGFIPNKILVSEIEELLKPLNQGIWFEACCGSGNFTIPLANAVQKVIATEIDESALYNFEQTLEHLPNHLQNLKNKIKLQQLNIHKETSRLQELLQNCDGIFVDPPRSGLQDFIKSLSSVTKKPKHFLYVSCFYQSMIEDIKKLIDLGYIPQKTAAIDQFPFSEQCEWIVLLEKP